MLGMLLIEVKFEDTKVYFQRKGCRKNKKDNDVSKNRTVSSLPVPMPLRLHGWRVPADE